MLEIIASVVAAVLGGGWILLREISSQLRALRHELENKIQAVDDRLSGRMDRLSGRMEKLENGQIDLARQIARLKGFLESPRRLPAEEPQAV